MEQDLAMMQMMDDEIDIAMNEIEMINVETNEVDTNDPANDN